MKLIDEEVKHPEHAGKIVKVGNTEVMVGSSNYIGREVQDWATIMVPLNEKIPFRFQPGRALPMVYWLPLVDYGGVPENWAHEVRFLLDQARHGRLAFWCTGGHGRTGTLLASLIALAEPDKDPIAEARARGCERMVETLDQLKGIVKLLPSAEHQRIVFTRHYGTVIDVQRQKQGQLFTDPQPKPKTKRSK